jgi:hypothetical protein
LSTGRRREERDEILWSSTKTKKNRTTCTWLFKVSRRVLPGSWRYVARHKLLGTLGCCCPTGQLSLSPPKYAARLATTFRETRVGFGFGVEKIATTVIDEGSAVWVDDCYKSTPYIRHV